MLESRFTAKEIIQREGKKTRAALLKNAFEAEFKFLRGAAPW